MNKKRKNIIKGMPSAVVLSIVIHVGLFLLAGMLVVFTVVKKEEKKFTPPKAIERPKMKLRKPKVKVKKTSKPRPTTRIVTKMNRASMPDIQLPEMSGMGEVLVGGIGGFDALPDLDEVNVFGGAQSIGNDFTGTFYDVKRDRSGRDIPMDAFKLHQILKEFVRSGWKTSTLSRYYRSPNNLYATTFMIPPILASLAPAAFGEKETLGYLWMAHYKGQIVHKEGLTFRFVGHGDAFMVVRVDGEVVLNASWPGQLETVVTPHWHSRSADSRKWRLGNNYAVVGDWITLKPNEPLDMEVIFGDRSGVTFCAMLVVQEKNVEYEKNQLGDPILPIFKTAEPSLDLIEAIHGDLVENQACVTNGPVFCDYNPLHRMRVNSTEKNISPDSSLIEEVSSDTKMRTWSDLMGNTFEAEFVTVIGGKMVLKNSSGTLRKIPLSRFSEKDRLFSELARSPDFKINFSKRSSLKTVPQGLIDRNPPRIFTYVFEAKLLQTSTNPYNHELQAEFFAIGEEIDGDNYILLDKADSSFMPSTENNRYHSFHGETVELRDYVYAKQRRGEKYGGYLVVITDCRGEIIDYATSHDWLFENLENLKEIPVGKHFDKYCVRVGPPRPLLNLSSKY